jgi:hypothetical protein
MVRVSRLLSRSLSGDDLDAWRVTIGVTILLWGLIQ